MTEDYYPPPQPKRPGRRGLFSEYFDRRTIPQTRSPNDHLVTVATLADWFGMRPESLKRALITRLIVMPIQPLDLFRQTKMMRLSQAARILGEDHRVEVGAPQMPYFYFHITKDWLKTQRRGP